MNVATSATVGPVPNSNKAGVAGANALLALPSRSLVGFLSLLNGLLNSTDDSEPPVAAPQSAKPRAIAFSPHHSGESDKSGKNIPGPQAESGGNAEVLSLRSGPHLSAAPASPAPRPALAASARDSPVPSQILSFTEFPQITRGTTGSTLALPDTALAVPLQPSESVDKSSAEVAFELRLTPQTAPANRTPVAVQQAQPPIRGNEVTAAHTVAKAPNADVPSASAKPAMPPKLTQPMNADKDPTQVSGPAPLARAWLTLDSDARSASPEKNVEPAPHSENPRPRIAFQMSPRNVVAASASDEIDSASHAPESMDVSKSTEQPTQVVFEADTRPNIAAAQLPLGTAETSAPIAPPRTTMDGATVKEQPAPPVGSGTPRIVARNRTSTEPGITSAISRPSSPNEKGNSQGEEMDDAESGTKSSKPDTPEKPTSNQKDIHVQDGTGLLSVLAGPANGTSSASPHAATIPVDPPAAGRVSTEIETNPTVRTQPMREISLRLGDTASNSVDIQMVERAGHVQVAVRTPDQELTTSLQANLGELVGRLEQKGYKTETWVPAATLHPTAVLTESAGSSGHSQDQPGHSSSWDGGQQQRQEQQESGRRQQARWMTQVEQTLNGEDTGTEGIPMEDQ